VNAVSALLVPAVGWALLHFVWKGALIGFATALSLRLLRDADPRSRYALLGGALLLCAVVPLCDAYRFVQMAVPASSAIGAPSIPLTRTAAPDALPRMTAWLVATWLLGVAVMSCRLAGGLLWVRRLRRTSAGATNPTWQAHATRLAERCGLSRPVALRVAADLPGPLTVGWWRPLVLVPAALLTHLPPDLLEALLAHEIAHIQRVDYLVNLLQHVVETLLFFHPAVWWLSRCLRIERERVADQLAAQLIGDGRRLALALEQLSLIQAADLVAPSAPVVAQAAHGGQLLDRIRRLCRPARPAAARWRRAPALALGLAALCIAPAALQSMPAALAELVPMERAVPSSRQASVQSGLLPATLASSVGARHVLVVDDATGRILFQKRPDDIVPIASLTKLMTAMVVLDAHPDLNRVIRIDANDAHLPAAAYAGLPAGASLPLRAVLQLALMSSDNSAAHALAQQYPGGLPAFREAVRAKIVALGLTRTRLDEPTGVSPLNTSTASDVALMVSAAARYPAIARATTDPHRIVTIDGRPVEYRNTNPLVGQQGWDIALSKTGYTRAAGRCLTMRLRGVGQHVTVVLLDADPHAVPVRDASTIRRLLLASRLV
jgi:serine-type D-Ala-D-Ala endopeptidase (penicillin-binding protein 7)